VTGQPLWVVEVGSNVVDLSVPTVLDDVDAVPSSSSPGSPKRRPASD